jgi:hypothetical protein
VRVHDGFRDVAATVCMGGRGTMRNDEGMHPEPVEWYLARDGQQYGPLSDAEMTKFRKLGTCVQAILSGVRTGCLPELPLNRAAK